MEAVMPGLAFEADLSLNADVIARLGAATNHMLIQMREELNTLFAMPTNLLRERQEGYLSGAAGMAGTVVPQARFVQNALRPNGFRYVLQTTGQYEASYAALRQRFLDATRRANPSMQPAQVSARVRDVLSHLDTARQRLSWFLNSGRTVTITVNNPENTRLVLQSWMTTGLARRVYCNPFTFFVQSRSNPNAYVRALRVGTPGALTALGPTIAMLHETDHVTGCMTTAAPRNVCSAIYTRPQAESATTSDVDQALSGHPSIAQVRVYQDPPNGQVAILGDNTSRINSYRTYYQGSPNENPTADLGVEWVRWPTVGELRHGRAP
jgi:hypothetical protein